LFDGFLLEDVFVSEKDFANIFVFARIKEMWQHWILIENAVAVARKNRKFLFVAIDIKSHIIGKFIANVN